MKLTSCLLRQHIGFMFKKHWLVQGKRVPADTRVEDHLKSLGIEVQDANEFVKEKVEHEPVQVIGMYDPPLPLDENHPDYKEKPCYTLGRNSVLLEGISQAQVLLNTIRVEDHLPDKIEQLRQVNLPSSVNEYVKNAIMSANMFDAETKKLPKIKDAQRPAYNFPRILGITDRRRNTIIGSKLIQVIERLTSEKARLAVEDVESVYSTEKDEDLLQLRNISDTLLSSNEPLSYIIDIPKEKTIGIPDLYPVKHTVTMPISHFYSFESVHPLKTVVSKNHPHTTWLHYNATEVTNLFETPVTEQQILGRALTHSFTVAAAYAKQKYGDVKNLPEPVFLNCIQTDGQSFHFGVLQLNTLDLSSNNETKNYWHSKNNLRLYDSCQYVKGVPMLENYNPETMKYISAICSV